MTVCLTSLIFQQYKIGFRVEFKKTSANEIVQAKKS